MKTILSKILHALKSLFLKLSVIVTLRLGKDKVDEQIVSHDNEESCDVSENDRKD